MPIETAYKKKIIPRAYYHGDSKAFLKASIAEIHDEIVNNSMQFDLTALQNMAWNEEIRILRNAVERLGDCYIAFEYSIPRMGKRVDAVLIKNNIVFLMEFKVGEKRYPQAAKDQVVDYALDLHNFHELSHSAFLVPVLVCTRAPEENNNLVFRDRIAELICCSEDNLVREINSILTIVSPKSVREQYYVVGDDDDEPTASYRYIGHVTISITSHFGLKQVEPIYKSRFTEEEAVKFIEVISVIERQIVDDERKMDVAKMKEEFVSALSQKQIEYRRIRRRV